MDGLFLMMEGSLLSKFFILQWMVALSLRKVVCYQDFCYPNGCYPCNYGRYSVVEISVTPLDCSLVIMEGSLFSRFLFLQWMVALTLLKVVCCRDFCYYNG